MLLYIFGIFFSLFCIWFGLSFRSIGSFREQIQVLLEVVQMNSPAEELSRLQKRGHPIANLLFDEDLSATPLGRHLSVDTLLDSRPPWVRVGIEQLPSIFTALGILFTFIGLVDGLEGINIDGSSDEIVGGMKTLLRGVGAAFYSSLFGVAASSVAMLFAKWRLDGISRQIELLIRAIDDSEMIRSPEDALVGIEIASKSQVNGTRKLLRVTEDQSAKIGSLATDLAAKLHDTLAPSLDNLSGAVNNMSNGSSEVHANALGGMMESFLKKFDESLGQQFGQLGEILDKTLQWHASTQEKLSETIRNIDRASLQQQKLLELQNELLQQSLRLEGDRKNRLDAMIENASTLSKQLVGLLDAFENLNTEFPALSGSLQRSANETVHATRALNDSVRDLKRGMEGFDEKIEMTSKEYGRLIAQIRNELEDGLQSTFSKFDTSTSNIVDRLSGTYINLGDVLAEFDRTLKRVNEVRR